MISMQEYTLHITMDDGDKFTDAVDAESKQQAVAIAHWNWEQAETIEVLIDER